MQLIRWNPWSIDRFFDDEWELPTIPGISRLAGQGLNLYETNDAIIAEAAVPGIPENRIDVTVDNNIVRISASTEEKKEDKEKRRYFMSSMNTSYNYAFRLPQGIITGQEPVCELNEGVLTLNFAKASKTPPKKLRITKKQKR